jgi:K+-transporting ATPase KdpF subunit
MDLLSVVQQNLGLITITAISLALTGYLVYAMLHPERF